LVQFLEAQVAQVHVHEGHAAAEHDLLRKGVEHASLHGWLEIVGGGSKMPQDDEKDIIEGASSWLADQLWARRVTERR
jgi:hypothetical protein